MQGESAAHAKARQELLAEEIELQRHIDRVAEQRRSLPEESVIATITAPDIADWRDRRLVKVSGSTVNRELCLISSVFTHAMKEWRMGITANPCSLVTKPRKPRPRTQRVSLTERQEIVKRLEWDGSSEPKTSPQWVAFAFYLALETAMRKGEILSLNWSDVDIEARHAHLDITKNGDKRYVPLSKPLLRCCNLSRTLTHAHLSCRYSPGTSTSCSVRRRAMPDCHISVSTTLDAKRPRQWRPSCQTYWS